MKATVFDNSSWRFLLTSKVSRSNNLSLPIINNVINWIRANSQAVSDGKEDSPSSIKRKRDENTDSSESVR